MNQKAEIITIGSEVLMGSVLNSNAQFLGRELSGLGFQVDNQVACQDDLKEIGDRLEVALGRSQLIILTGGLGPTPDDVTRDAVADYFKVPLIYSPKQYNLIKKYYKRSGKKVPAIVKREALFPKNATPLVNRYGVALGFSVSLTSQVLVSLPGVPREMQKMFYEIVKPLVKKKFKNVAKKHSFVVRTVGVSEPTVMGKLGKSFFKEGDFEFGIYPDAGEVCIRIRTASAVLAKKLLSKSRSRLKKDCYADHETTLSTEIGRLLKKKKKTIAVAESCTGGVLSSELTKVAGASQYFKGSITAYHNAIKESCLDISKKDLKKHGAVSPKIAGMMAKAVQSKMNTYYGIGISGVAGPAGGTKDKPIGTVIIALAAGKRLKIWKHQFWGDRQQVQIRSTKKALEHLWRDLIKI